MAFKLLIIFGIIVVIGGVIILILGIVTKSNKKDFELTYKISAGIPFRWEVDIADKSIVQFVNSYVVRNENVGGMVGAPIYTNYVFRGLRQGKTDIIFKFVNFTNNEVSREERYKVLVDNNLKIVILETNK